jgi:D-beta-D-heptose 7-phosphate kinase/D-beta-D-heptose 1-phosphate adenosyltransferase
MLPLKSNQVWLNGSFDVLHSGHIKLFRIARTLAGSNGTVFVGTDTDERISTYKGPTRPINNLQDRVLMLSSIKYIDHVLPFASNAELEAHISAITPDYMIIGDDYRGKDIIGSQFIKKIIYVSRDNKSTSNIVDMINWSIYG